MQGKHARRDVARRCIVSLAILLAQIIAPFASSGDPVRTRQTQNDPFAPRYPQPPYPPRPLWGHSQNIRQQPVQQPLRRPANIMQAGAVYDPAARGANVVQANAVQFGGLPAPQSLPTQAVPLPYEVNPVPAAAVPPAPLPAQSLEPTFVFNFSDAPWEIVLRQIAKRFNHSIQFSHRVEGTFTYFDGKPQTISESIDILNDYLLPMGAILVRQEGKLTLVGAHNGIPDGLIPFVPLHRLAETGRNELISVAIPVEEGEPAIVVQELASLLSPLGRAEPLTNSRRVIVTDTGTYVKRIYDLMSGAGVASGGSTPMVYELRHAKASEVAKAVNDFYAARLGFEGSVGGPVQQLVVAEDTTESIIIQDSVNRGSEIYALIEQLDRPPRQVLIQALLVEVQLNNTCEFGVELGFQDSVLFNRSVIDNILTITQTNTTAGGNQTTSQQIISQTATPGLNFNNQPLGNNISASPSTVAGQALSNFGLGRVNGDLGFGGLVLSAGSESVNILLRALSAQYNVDVLSRPQIRAIHNREALIQIGQQVPVVDGVAVTATGSANPVIRQDQSGIILKVTPKISPDSRVLIDVKAEKSAFQLAPGSGVPIFTDATNGNVIEAPVKDVTTAETVVTMQSGQTVVLGGMITNEDVVVERKVPFLGDIPIVKHAFRHDLRDHQRRELLIFLTPHVVETDCDTDRLNEKMKSHVHIPASAYEFEDASGATHPGCPNPEHCTPDQNTPAHPNAPAHPEVWNHEPTPVIHPPVR